MNHITKLQENLLTAVQTSPYREKTIVFGEGAEAPLLMMIGEAPGGDEEKQGPSLCRQGGEEPFRLSGGGRLKKRGDLYFQRSQAAPNKGKPQNGQGGESSPLCGGDRVFPALFAGGNPNDCAEGACYTGKCPPQGGHRGEEGCHRGIPRQTCRAGGRKDVVCTLSPCGSHL